LELKIVCTAYERPILLMSQLCSFAAQTRINFAILVIHDGYNELVEAVVSDFQRLYPHIEIAFKFSKIRYNDFGHSLREIALHEAEEKYMLLTNDDNYYTPNFIEEMMPPLDIGDFDISYCNMIHSHLGYQPLATQPRLNWIDIGAFIFDTKLGQRAGFEDKSFAADGIFFEKMIKNGARAFKNEKYLYVHN